VTNLTKKIRARARKAARSAANRPALFTALAVILVALHTFVGWRKPDLRLPRLTHGEDVWQVYLAVSGVASMVAGFAGVIVIYAMTQGSPRLATLRTGGGDRLKQNWLSPVRISFIASILAVIASSLDVAKYNFPAVLTFELASLFCVHGMIRLTWLLGILIEIVKQQDRDSRSKTTTLHELRRQG
jgi:hypothetical protein